MINTNIESTEFSLNEYQRYSRQLLLESIQIEGQKRLSNAKIACIGAGALGSVIIMYLAAAGINNITIIDDDIVDISNLQRQPIHNMSFINHAKTESASHYISKLNPNLTITTIPNKLDRKNIFNIVSQHDIILDGTDNIETRYLIDDFCILLGKPWIYGGVFQFQGQVSVFNFQGGACYQDLYPKTHLSQEIPSCSEGGILGVVPGLIGMIQVTETLKIILGIGKNLRNNLLIIDTLNLEFKKLSIKKLIESNYSSKVIHNIKKIPSTTSSINILEITEFKKIYSETNYLLIDVRSFQEFSIEQIPGAQNYPLAQIEEKTLKNLLTPIQQKIILYCSLNSRANLAYKKLVQWNLPCFVLKNGFQGWKTLNVQNLL
uniref:molybdopterin biosynthesis protein n=1 Tax=Stylonema alsidii TaxID=35155 RepID=UPI001FCD6A7E|nr:molybdopterin biosynthesis protein [Stylonema alsidii]UNJ15212.1 molybdopterin biosynthesis protein [Stylonema alsidii]